MSETVQLTVDIEGIGTKQLSFDMAELLAAVKAEHLAVKCSKEHSISEISDMLFDCPECHGTSLVLTPFGEKMARLVTTEQLRNAKENYRMTQREYDQRIAAY
jgi:Zn finger protein HypA/HybF involved in hydrogenase expression